MPHQLLGNGAHRDVHDDMMLLTMRIVLETLFGSEAGVDQDAVTHGIETFMLEGFGPEVHGVRRLLPAWVPTPGARRRAARSRPSTTRSCPSSRPAASRASSATTSSDACSPPGTRTAPR